MKTLKPFSTLAAFFALLVIVGACSQGGSYPSWSYGNRPEAQEAPSPLSNVYADIYADRLATPQEEGESGEALPGGQTEQHQQAFLTGQHEESEAHFERGAYEDPQNRTGEYNATSENHPVQHTSVPDLPQVKVALLLPLSGKHEALGQAMLKAAQMSLFDVGHDGFELLPRDTKGTSEGATVAAQEALRDGAQLILGPVFSDSVRAAKNIIGSYNVNMIAFSTDWTLADNNSFMMGFLPFDQVERVIRYASQQGIATVGVLAPNTPYGSAVVSTYRSISPRLGVFTNDVQLFDPSSSNLSPVVRSFAKYDERAESLNQLIRPMKARLKATPTQTLRNSVATLESMDTLGEIPYDAILMPVGGDQARALANLASHYDLLPSRVRRLGTGLWDDKGLAAEPALDGAWFAAPAPGQRSEFENRFLTLYGSRPPRLTSLAYDATALAAVLARSGLQNKGTPAFDRYSISNPNGFAGVDGIFRFRNDGLVERGLAILEYRDGGIVVIDEAPITFQRPSTSY